jgi:predicted DNA-binding transcriptional regulator YafY
MRRAERLFRLVNELRARGVARADDLATTLEVSMRTVYRDIAHLQGSGLPIEGAAGVGYLLRPGFDLPNMTFTFAQIEALAIGLSFAESLDDAALAAAAREVRAKLQAAMPQPETRRLTDAPYFSLRRTTGAPLHARLLRQAVRKRRIVAMDYRDADGKITHRRVRPLAIWNLTDGWMFSGWCALRHDFRTFRFDRIVALVLTDDSFDDDPAKGLQAFLDRDRCEAVLANPSIAAQ